MFQPTALPTPFLTPEVSPSIDEEIPVIEPNLAGDESFCKDLTQYLVSNYWYPYLQMQMKFWPVWEQLDRAWRAALEAIDLDLMDPSLDKKNFDIANHPNKRDGVTLRVSPTDFHKQWDALLKVGIQISWQEGIPVQAIKPDYVFETLYNPVQQTVDAVNSILVDTAREAKLSIDYRKNLHAFFVYGHCWAQTDLKRTFQDIAVKYRLGDDHMSAQAALAMLIQQHQAQPQFEVDGTGSAVATFQERKIKEFVTSFRHLDVDAVFTDLTMSCEDMDRHPCPFVRTHLAEHELERNEYHPETNPFGWMNVQQAITETDGHFSLSAVDEAPLRAKLKTRFGLSDQTVIPAKHTKKQLWTAYAMLRVGAGRKIDTGEGVTCPTCNGGARLVHSETAEEIKCPDCKAGKVRPRAERYVIQWYGAMQGSQVCVRAQKMAENQRVPLKYAADMIEDTSCAAPLSKGEVALNDLLILAKYENQFLHSKDMAIHRGFKVKADCISADKDFDKPGINIEFESDPNEVERLESSTFDETITLAPAMAERRDRIKNIMGATDQLIGIIEQGRRSALELGNAIDASKNPIVVTVDSYNRQMMGAWADDTIRNLDIWGDRDWIRRKTGKEYFGRMTFRTAVGEEFIRKLTRIQNERGMIEMLPALASVFPGVIEIIPQILQKLLDDNGMSDVRVPDGGMAKAQQSAMRIVAKILGDGQIIPPTLQDPDEIYCAVFGDALRAAQEDPDDPWYGPKYAANLPILQQRFQIQQAIAQQKQQQMMMQQIQMQAMSAHADAAGKEAGAPRDAKKIGKAASGHGQAMQGAQGEHGKKAA